MRSALLLVLACALLAAASPGGGRGPHDGQGHRPVAGRWKPLDSAIAAPQQHVLWFSLVQQNLPELERIVSEVSNPKSSEYGQYLTPEELAGLIAPDQLRVAEFLAWLEEQGLGECGLVRSKDAVKCVATPMEVAKALDAELSAFQCRFTGKVIMRDAEWTMPAQWADIVELVHGVTDFPPLSENSKLRGKHHEKHTDGRGSRHHKGRREERRQALLEQTLDGPVFITVRSREMGVIKVEFIPPCLGGDLDACPNNAVTGVDATLVPQYDTYPLPPMSASLAVNCSLSNPKAPGLNACEFEIHNVKGYVPWVLSFSLSYADGTTSPVYDYPYFIASTPRIVTQDLQALYKIPYGLHSTNENATQCVVEFEQQYYSSSDLSLYFEYMGLQDYSDLVTVLGPNFENDAGTEANLDIQWIMGMAPGAPTLYWSNYANSSVEIDHILEWQYELGNMTNPPLVSSLSYAMTEATANNYLGDGYVERSNTEFQKLASMGLTMIFSAGDAGANSLSAPPMGVVSCDPTHAMWPAESPYVTALSATYGTPAAEPICYRDLEDGGINCLNNPMGEVAVGIDRGMFWTTGGTFSNVSAMPDYQVSAVESYFSQNIASFPPSSYYNASGRAYPDVSTVGHNLVIVLDGETRVLDGTSASAPIFAGLITLLNSARLNAFQPPLGFVNPLLYQISQEHTGAFNDVTVGHNACGGFGPPFCCANGWLASPGWDPVTGLGTPNFEVIYAAVMNM